MTQTWYLIHSKPNKEGFLCRQLQSNAFEAFCPEIRVQPINPRARTRKPYFPGYVFVHLDPEQVPWSSLGWMPGASGFVSFDGRPADVPENLIEGIRRRVASVNAAGGELFDGLKPGDALVIQDGPFAGYEAIFDARLSGVDRVRVLLKMLQKRELRLELLAGQVRRKTLH